MPATASFPSFTVRDGITIVYTCPLLDHLFPGNGWIGQDPDVTQKAVAAWLNEHRAHYYSWEGPSFMRLAEEDRAIEAAKTARASIVVIDPLS